MPERPSHIWKDMPGEKRVQAADAFWRDDESPDVEVQQVEAAIALARRFNFRPKSIQTLPIERRARQLAQMTDLSDAVATRLLVAYHFAAQRPLMAAFLDALGITHEAGLITEEEVAPPDRDRLTTAIDAVGQAFDRADLNCYIRTLLVLDGNTWRNLEGLIDTSHQV
jgi:hypothetical protein